MIKVHKYFFVSQTKLTLRVSRNEQERLCKGTSIQWIHSYVTGNKFYCIYKAENEELLKEFGKKGGFPVNAVTEIHLRSVLTLLNKYKIEFVFAKVWI